jgi:hypothetical protein
MFAIGEDETPAQLGAIAFLMAIGSLYPSLGGISNNGSYRGATLAERLTDS